MRYEKRTMTSCWDCGRTWLKPPETCCSAGKPLALQEDLQPNEKRKQPAPTPTLPPTLPPTLTPSHTANAAQQPLQFNGARIFANIVIGSEVVAATVDTRSPNSSISEALIQRIVAKDPDYGPLIYIDGGVQLNVRLGTNGFQFKFAFAPLSLEEMVLGLDFLNEIGTTLICGGDSLKLELAPSSSPAVVTAEQSAEPTATLLASKPASQDTLKSELSSSSSPAVTAQPSAEPTATFQVSNPAAAASQDTLKSELSPSSSPAVTSQQSAEPTAPSKPSTAYQDTPVVTLEASKPASDVKTTTYPIPPELETMSAPMLSPSAPEAASGDVPTNSNLAPLPNKRQRAISLPPCILSSILQKKARISAELPAQPLASSSGGTDPVADLLEADEIDEEEGSVRELQKWVLDTKANRWRRGVNIGPLQAMRGQFLLIRRRRSGGFMSQNLPVLNKLTKAAGKLTESAVLQWNNDDI